MKDKKITVYETLEKYDTKFRKAKRLLMTDYNLHPTEISEFYDIAQKLPENVQRLLSSRDIAGLYFNVIYRRPLSLRKKGRL